MKITIHRGLNQIGGCITEIQSLSGIKILIDLGHNLPDGGGVSEDKYESPENLDQLLDGCSAVFYTHYHGDHLGFAAEIHERGVAQYMGPLAIVGNSFFNTLFVNQKLELLYSCSTTRE